MPIVANLLKPRGLGKRKLFIGTASITGTGTISTGLSTVEEAVACVKNSPTTIPTRTASITGISGGDVSVVVTEHAATANSVATAAVEVTVFAVGY